LAPVAVSRLWVALSRLAVVDLSFSASRYSCHGRNEAQFKTPVDPLSEFRSPLETSLAKPSRPPNLEDPTTQLLSWAFVPYSTSSHRGPPLAGVACPLRSALRVWLPSRRFTPPAALPVLFRTGSALGIPLRSLLLPQGIRAFPPESTHLPFFPTLFPTAEAAGRPVGPRFLGFAPCESPLITERGMSAPTIGCSPGFHPPEV